MTIAVTGATGHLGGLVLAALQERGVPTEDLVAVVRDASKAAPLAVQGIDVRVAPYEDVPALETALADVDTLLLVSGSEPGPGRFPGHRNVIDAAKTAGVGRIVYTSAPKATDSELVLAPDHAATEEYLVASGVPFTIGRNNWYHENYAQQIDIVRATGTLTAAAGDGKVASASRADFAEAFAVLLTTDGHEGQTYELGGDVHWTFDDLAAALSEVVGREVVYQPVDAATLITSLTSAGLDEGTAGFVAALDGNIAAGALDVDGSALARLIGRPTTPLVDGLKAV